MKSHVVLELVDGQLYTRFEDNSESGSLANSVYDKLVLADPEGAYQLIMMEHRVLKSTATSQQIAKAIGSILVESSEEV